VSAFEDAMTAPSAKNSPCFVIPANHKWLHNLAVFQIIAETMEGLDMSCPKSTVDLAEIKRKYHAAQREETSGGKRKNASKSK
jgi:hypothetical protein